MSDRATSAYLPEANALDVALDIQISEIRTAHDRGEITTREAADLRIAALEEHLARVRQLRVDHFGPDGDDADRDRD